MDNSSYRNLCGVADCINFLIQNENKLTKKDNGNIKDPISLSRKLLRRVLKDTFPDCEIRKNKYTYAIRSNNAELNKMVRLAGFPFRMETLTVFSKEIRKYIEEEIIPIEELLREVRRNGITFCHRSEDRLFFYIGFSSYSTDHSYSIEAFQNYNIQVRVEALLRIKEILNKMNYSPLVEKLLKFRSIYSWNLPYNWNTAAGSYTEDFIEFANNSRRFYSIPEALRFYLTMKNEEKASEEPDTDKDEESSTLSNQEPALVSRITLRNSNSVEETNNEIQNRFNSALSNIVARRRTETEERFLRVNLDTATEQDLLDCDYLTQEEYVRFLDIFPYKKTVFDSDNKDIVDDIDDVKDGIYFTTCGKDINYKIYVNEELVLETEDLEKAISKYSSLRTQPETIRYLEE